MSKNKGDLISREALLGKAQTIYRDAGNGTIMTHKVVLSSDILMAPAVDAVKVVRCKDCKHHSIEETECGAKYIACNRFDEVMEADDFCSYGERYET